MIQSPVPSSTLTPMRNVNIIPSGEAGAFDKALRQDGYVVMKEVFDPAWIDQLRAAFNDEFGNREPDWLNRHCLHTGKHRWMFTLPGCLPFFDPALYASDQLLPHMQRQLDDNCSLQSMLVVNAYPGAEMGPAHTDHHALFPNSGKLNFMLPPWALQVGIPLIDLDEKTGSTAIWPGSNHELNWQENRDQAAIQRLDGAIVPYIQRGDCFITDYRTWHCGTPNLSDLPRPMLFLLYTRLWFRDYNNYVKQPRLNITADQLQQVPERYRFLFAHLGMPDNRE